jgi:uncharacterized iron-regulated protein
MLCAAAFSSGAAAQVAQTWPDRWQSPLLSDHPLVGRIWSARDQKLVTPMALGEILATSTLVLIGEVHDNADHHRIQGWAIGLIAGRLAQRTSGRGAAAAVFEQISADQRSALDSFAELAASSPQLATADRLFELLDWEKTGWPPAEIYKPLFETVIQSKLTILPGEAPRAQIRTVAKSGLDAVGAADRRQLKLDQPLPAERQDSLLAELEASHCGLMSRSALANMAAAQRYRDAYLARALVDAADTYGRAVLIAGDGHVRRDRGVPWYVRGVAPGKSLVAVMLVEVEEGKNGAAAYLEGGLGGRPIADYVVFTPRAERADPCERMREQAGRRG